MKFCGIPESSKTTRTAGTVCNSLRRKRKRLGASGLSYVKWNSTTLIAEGRALAPATGRNTSSCATFGGTCRTATESLYRWARLGSNQRPLACEA